jgi:hypothetical protein
MPGAVLHVEGEDCNSGDLLPSCPAAVPGLRQRRAGRPDGAGKQAAAPVRRTECRSHEY